jgi:hypothetical protein
MAFEDYIAYFNSTCIVRLHGSSRAGLGGSIALPYTRETLRLSHGNLN